MSDKQPSQASPPVEVGWGSALDIGTVVSVARGDSSDPSGHKWPQVRLAEGARRQMQAASDWVDEVVGSLSDPLSDVPQAYYGINTGFGSLAGKATLSHEYETRVLMRNLLASHAAGVREYFDEESVRAALLLRAHSLAQGYSGVRCLLVDKLTQMLNQGVYPAVPCMGSLGASGDLAPLSHLTLVLSEVPRPPQGKPVPELDTTSGEAFIAVKAPVQPSPDSYFHVTQQRPAGRQTLWRRVPGQEAMQAAGGQIELRAKEGLALNNGTTFSCALAALSVHDALNLLENAELALAMTLEGIRGFADPFFAEVHSVRPHPGALESARKVRRYTAGSSLLDGSRQRRPQRVPPQDPYSIRCSPQVHGAVRDSLDFIHKTVEIELNATTDNPLIFLQLPRRYKSVSGGNFHGAPLAFVMDYLGIILTELGSVSERRIFKMTDFATDNDFELPSFLIDDDVPAGLNSGLMIPQYTAASLVSECKTLAHPDSVDSIPSSANQEDHVSMSLNAARHARQIVDNVEHVVAIEFLCAAQALEWRKKKNPSARLGIGSQAALKRFRCGIGYLKWDRALYPDIRASLKMVRSGELVQAARQAVQDSPEGTV